ncbi:MAG TPA: thiamine phosphate synthase [Chthoniobacteraceae bacterium]|nr:thiamine phosphate synthase [Chthoniobacteraceae bacterium]
MGSKSGSNPLRDAQLYGIVDLHYVAINGVGRVAEKLIAGGVDVLQLRAKGSAKSDIEKVAGDLSEVTEAAGVPFIVNDHADIARRTGADGVHLGQDDGPIEAARPFARGASPGDADAAFIVGRSTHSFEQAAHAEIEGADYIGFGPLFPTPTKAGRPAVGLHDIARVEESLHIPVFCIGGIHGGNLQAVLDAGARRVVIVSAILRAADIIGYCRDVKAALLARPISN